METITVEVAYALPARQEIVSLRVPSGTTVALAIEQSGILALFPDIDLMRQEIGIFSQPATLSDELKEGDRVEIYRPLLIDPKEARRQRVRSARQEK